MSDLPLTVTEMNARVGTIYGLNGVQKAGRQLASWVVEAALQRWPNLADFGEDETLAKVWANAVARWGPDVVAFRDSIIEIELEVLRCGAPTA